MRAPASVVGDFDQSGDVSGKIRSITWPEVLSNAVYLKNHVYNKVTQVILYQMMFGKKPDIHRVRTFGALAYVYIPVTPGRRKHHNNAKIW